MQRHGNKNTTKPQIVISTDETLNGKENTSPGVWNIYFEKGVLDVALSKNSNKLHVFKFDFFQYEQRKKTFQWV